ncbi:MAG: rod shape-determining protein RodA [Flavobacteriales bacterium]|mgnify:FL=1|nr:rod shape-determining protein RodA [Flavobacteriales bacterium]|tara:strand:+ start:26265 stop:27518 length:1254 start_codon:yes stop_codon:yes gene_type:complete
MHQKPGKINWIIILIYCILVFIGWASIYSSSFDPESSFEILNTKTIYGKQLLFIACSCIVSVFILLIDIKMITRLGYIVYFASIISLILVLFIGKEVGGAKAWFNFGSFGLQPAEFAKYGTILAISKFIHDKNIYLNKYINTLKVCSFILLPFLLILKQPDAGSALIYTSLIIMFFREGLQIKYIFFGVTSLLISLSTIIVGVSATIIVLILLHIGFAYLLQKHKKRFLPAFVTLIIGMLIVGSVNYGYDNILQPHQKERIDIIIGKEKNNLGSGYNLNQSLIAIGSGGFFGKGYLNGTQTKFNFVPEQNTDFIFCTIGEEFGFTGSCIIIMLFVTLIVKIILISEKQTSRFSRIYGYSLSAILFAHIVINISMTLGIMPVIGIPLPFISYGGSSLLSFSILLFTFLKLDSYRIYRF